MTAEKYTYNARTSPYSHNYMYIESTPTRASVQGCPFRLTPILRHTAEDSRLSLMGVSGYFFLKKTENLEDFALYPVLHYIIVLRIHVLKSCRRGEANRHPKYMV